MHIATRIELSYSSLLEPKREFPQIAELLRYCIAKRGALRLTLNQTGITLAAEAAAYNHRYVALVGHWRSPFLEGYYQETGALALLPFVIMLEELCFSHHCLFSLGRDDRTVADLFMRNYFYAACRRELITICSSNSKPNTAITKASSDLARTYLWIARDNIKDNSFHLKNAAELILAKAHMPLAAFSHVLLESGTAEMRKVASLAESSLHGEKKRAFIKARERMLISSLIWTKI